MNLSDSTYVIAADSGADHALALGLRVDAAVGDFDSISDQARQWLTDSDTPVVAHRADKDLSDLELALELASVRSPSSVVVAGLSGGRVDHGLLNLVVLADPRWKNVSVQGLAADCLVTVVHDHAHLSGTPGSLLSIVPIGGPATLSTEGLRYRLRREPLSPTSSRGLSNVIIADRADVTVHDGVVLVVQPEAGEGRW